MDALGKRLVKALVEDKDSAKLVHAGIDENDLFDEARKVYKWSYDFFVAKGEWPTVSQIEENTKIEMPSAQDSLEYMCDLVRKRKLGKSLEGDFKKGLEKLEARDPDAALELLSEIQSKHAKHKETGKPRSFRRGGLDRHSEYQKLQESPGLLGIPTPWKGLNDAIQGWVNGQLHVLMAMTNVGKTWACLLFADHAMMLGFKVLFVTMEMSTVRVERRLDAVHYKLPFGELRDVELDLFTEARWRDDLRRGLFGTGDIVTVDKKTVQYVSDVSALVQEQKPDLVIVDGGYRFLSRKGAGGNWEGSAQIVAELQTTAELTNLPWIVSTQQGEIAAGSRMENKERAYKVKYAKEWIINPDVAFEMYSNDDLKILKQMEWRLLRERDSKGEDRPDKFITNWDLTQMKFDQLYIDDNTGSVSTAVTY